MKRTLNVLALVAWGVLALTLLASGFVKAIDPLGTQYKLQDYLTALHLTAPDWLTLSAAVALCAFELVLGACMALAVSRRFVTRLVVLFMGVMTVVTVWIYIADPVQDCGCFGDALHLTNGQTLLKNVVLLSLAMLAAWRWQTRPRLLRPADQWLATQGAAALSVGLSLWSLYDLPLIDFRPYHVGADIRQGMAIPEGAEKPEFATTFVMEKDGERREFSLDDYPDSTWTFIDSRTVTVKQGYVPPIHDFSITEESGDDITDAVLSDTTLCLLLVAPVLEKADDQNFGDIDRLYEHCQDRGFRFLCLTASGAKAITRWRDATGAEYPFCHTDAVTLKTIVRSNPGLVALRRGTVLAKWSHNRLPEPQDIDALATRPSASR